ncbi:hypothetical protein [Burkholderia sp. NLJ2]|uniref:hypothetical protein n=1 Tax=Burkholderia sp. NLJ2 TaxID=3090699 RepID=UPI003C6C11F3
MKTMIRTLSGYRMTFVARAAISHRPCSREPWLAARMAGIVVGACVGPACP